MMIDSYQTHSHIKPEDLDAVLIVQVITWMEESHYWQPTQPENPRIVKCKWCGAERLDYLAPLSRIPMDKVKLCPGNPLIKALKELTPHVGLDHIQA